MGRSGIINFQGRTIGGISGIYSKFKYSSPRTFEDYYYRDKDVDLLYTLENAQIDLFVSHDWPQNIVFYGNMEELLNVKPFLRHEVSIGEFGSPPLYKLLHILKPKYWFAAHMHVFYKATYGPTQFVALNKNSRHGGWLHVKQLIHFFR